MRFRKTVYFFFTAILVLAVFELTAYVTLRSTGQLPPQGLSAQVYSTGPVYEYSWFTDLKPHPFFGYLTPRLHELIESLPAPGPKESFVILVLGGSVAEMFGGYLQRRPEFESELRARLPQIGNKKLEIWNFGMAAAHQPQQFQIAAFLFDRVDLIINLDGFNEMRVSYQDAFIPYEYPAFALWQTRAPQIGWAARKLLFGLVETHRFISGIPARFSPAAHSYFYFAFWKISGRASMKGAEALFDSIQRSYFRNLKVRREFGTPEEIPVKAAMWKKYTELEFRLNEPGRNKTFFFLQPNQYLKDSKPLTFEERVLAIDPAIEDMWHQRMTSVRKAALELSSLPVYDETQLFVNVRESLYVDNCCHFNEAGLDLLMKDILRKITAKGAYR